MEEPDKEIKSLLLTQETIEIIYENDIIEIITKDSNGYKKIHDAWLLEQPMFISDIYKTQMRDLNYASRNNSTSLSQLNEFFQPENYEDALKFINYMRKRDLTFEKQKWTVVVP